MNGLFFPSALDPVPGHTAALTLAAVLLIAAIGKLRDAALFREVLANYDLLPAALLSPASVALPLLEALAGALLLWPDSRPVGAPLALGLLALVTAGIVINLLRGRHRIDCGCGGNDVHTPLSWSLVARNALLAVLGAAASMPVADRPTVWLDTLAAAAATLFLLGLYACANQMLSNHPRLIELRDAP